MSETNRLREIKHELQARNKIINELAHELNNPLAALTFLLHLVTTSTELAAKDRELLEEAVLQLNRISDTVREVVAQTQEAARRGAEAEDADMAQTLDSGER